MTCNARARDAKPASGAAGGSSGSGDSSFDMLRAVEAAFDDAIASGASNPRRSVASTQNGALPLSSSAPVARNGTRRQAPIRHDVSNNEHGWHEEAGGFGDYESDTERLFTEYEQPRSVTSSSSAAPFHGAAAAAATAGPPPARGRSGGKAPAVNPYVDLIRSMKDSLASSPSSGNGYSPNTIAPKEAPKEVAARSTAGSATPIVVRDFFAAGDASSSDRSDSASRPPSHRHAASQDEAAAAKRGNGCARPSEERPAAGRRSSLGAAAQGVAVLPGGGAGDASRPPPTSSAAAAVARLRAGASLGSDTAGTPRQRQAAISTSQQGSVSGRPAGGAAPVQKGDLQLPGGPHWQALRRHLRPAGQRPGLPNVSAIIMVEGACA